MKRILVIDDDADVLEVTGEALNYEGYEVKTVEETNDIFTLIKDYQPDLLLIDFLLNGINGGEICHQVKSDAKTANLPVIIFTAYNKVFQSLGNYGCDGYLSKPFDLDDLLGQVGRLTNTCGPFANSSVHSR